MSRRLVRAIAGTALLGATYVEVRKPGIAPWEETVFRAANGAPDSWRVPVRAVMQTGDVVAAPVAAAVAFLAGRRALAGRLLAGGALAWFGAKAVKPMGGRAAARAGARHRADSGGDRGRPRLGVGPRGTGVDAGADRRPWSFAGAAAPCSPARSSP